MIFPIKGSEYVQPVQWGVSNGYFLRLMDKLNENAKFLLKSLIK